MLANLDAFMAWFASHRTAFGGVCTSMGAIMVGAAQYYPSTDLQAAGAIVTLIGTHLAATGMFRSDEYHRDKQQVLDTRVDRRRPDATIPLLDLVRLSDTKGQSFSKKKGPG